MKKREKMKTQKIKRYRSGVSRKFPTTHPRAGEQTDFPDKILKSSACDMCPIHLCDRCEIGSVSAKLHTIRSNYPLWKERMDKVQAGEAVIELFYWSDKPYNSKQVVFATLDKDSGCGVQPLIFPENFMLPVVCGLNYPEPTWYKDISWIELAKNDGLSLEDFKACFKGYDLSKPMAIIHFTKFRY